MMKTKTLLALVAIFWLSESSATFAKEKLPPELPLWNSQEPKHSITYDNQEQVRSLKARSGSPSGSNRVFSFVSQATYVIHRPEKPNGVALVICPGGGYRDVWLDREGHDLAIWLKEYGITSLVLKYRTNSGKAKDSAKGNDRKYSWRQYLPAVTADARQAIRILRKDAKALGIQRDKIGICGFSAGGNLALLTTLFYEPKVISPPISGMPDFAGLFYPWFRDDYRAQIASRSAPESATRKICPIFIMNASDDLVTPASKCIEFYSALLKHNVPTELHIFSKGSHGFDLGAGRGESAANWPNSFVAWMRDSKIID